MAHNFSKVDKVYFGQLYEYSKYIDVIFVEGKCKVFEGYRSWIKSINTNLF